MKKTTLFILVLLLFVLPLPAQEKVPARFRIVCTDGQAGKLSVLIHSHTSSGTFTFQDRKGGLYSGRAHLLYPDGKNLAGISLSSQSSGQHLGSSAMKTWEWF